MELKTLTATLSVAPQIGADDIETLKSKGIRAIICNRPDGEAADQPRFEEIERAARAAGMEARFIPVDASGITDAAVEAFRDALATLPAPVLAYCRSGMRSATLWSALEARSRSMAETISARAD